MRWLLVMEPIVWFLYQKGKQFANCQCGGRIDWGEDWHWIGVREESFK